MDLNLTNKTALVTGSTKGIGFAIASLLAGEGAKAIINGRSEENVAAALKKIRQSVPDGKIDGFVGDLSTEKGTTELLKKYPEVDILVNNLGIFEPKAFEDITDADWRRFFEINVLSGVRLSRAYIAGMKAKNWGRIIFISSESGVQIPLEMIHYGTSKTAQLAVSRGLAEYCAGTGVTVNAILPGPTRSGGVEEFVSQLSGGKSFEEFEKEFINNIRPSSLIKRFATTEEVAALVAFVCSTQASAITGAALRVDGGVVRSCF